MITALFEIPLPAPQRLRERFQASRRTKAPLGGDGGHQDAITVLSWLSALSDAGWTDTEASRANRAVLERLDPGDLSKGYARALWALVQGAALLAGEAGADGRELELQAVRSELINAAGRVLIESQANMIEHQLEVQQLHPAFTKREFI